MCAQAKSLGFLEFPSSARIKLEREYEPNFFTLFPRRLKITQNRVFVFEQLDVRAIVVKAIVGHLSGSAGYFFLLLFITIQIPSVWDADFQKNKKFFRER